jgi:hypothetical protein
MPPRKSSPRRRLVVPLSAQTTPQRGYCTGCRRQILTARYDAQIRHFDPQPLSQLGECQALLLGLKTWWVFDSFIYKRNVEAINSSPTGRGGVIYRDHHCAHPQPVGELVHFPGSNYDREEPDF